MVIVSQPQFLCASAVRSVFRAVRYSNKNVSVPLAFLNSTRSLARRLAFLMDFFTAAMSARQSFRSSLTCRAGCVGVGALCQFVLEEKKKVS